MNRKQRRAAGRSGAASAAAPTGAAVWLATGMGHHQAGRLADAEASYRRALAVRPGDANALHLLGTALQDQGRLDDAVAAYRRAVGIAPDHVDAYADLGNALQAQGRFDEAVTAYANAIRLKPDYAEMFSNLGLALRRQGHLEDAIEAFCRATAIKPDYGEAYSNLGNALLAQGRRDESVAAYRQAIAARPGYAEAHSNLGVALQEQGETEAAIAAYRRAIALQPDYAEAHANLGNALRDQGRHREAIAAYRRAIGLRPNHALAWSNLGNALRDQGRLTEAEAACRRAIALVPDLAMAHSNLGNALQEQGRLQEAEAAFRRAIAIAPDYAPAHSNLLMCLHYATPTTNAALLAEALAFGRRYDGLAETNHDNARDPERRLRIGYLSADFRNHPVGYFLTRVLAAHDHANVEIHCYADQIAEDGMTARLRGCADHWHVIAGLTDADAAAMIRRDGIDILVDLAGHSANNRLSLFARRPAPVQATWIGYFGTTGLSAMDAILADRFVVPDGDEAFFTETVWRLPDSFLCYAPHELDIVPARPPVLGNGFVTFGCFNNHAKITAETARAWADILRRVEGSRLFLKNRSLGDTAVADTLAGNFATLGIARERLTLEGQSPLPEMLAAYRRVDIALDPFPFGGGTTTAEALWMGVPVVTLLGQRWVGRMSASILTVTGLADLVAPDRDAYVIMAAALAGDHGRLSQMHDTLRPMMEASPFCDGPRFARGLEAAYRGMWEAWCAGSA